ncbi:DUF7167 family protein [Cytobacillus praedii]|uniref:DUF7167 domain-containing protein n=1 Tax=Cytobacillus praedii TaxID=1742358 RepID=A0A4R1AK61_9BACI|nr:hypothetical protein [Cytobacillus praedii]TCI99978.1 hypothetical protein E0Y62_27110 [Cytobacillus praedii]
MIKNGEREVTFSLCIGLQGKREETFTIKQLGIMPEEYETEEELEKLLEEEWKEWIWNYIDGGIDLNDQY